MGSIREHTVMMETSMQKHHRPRHRHLPFKMARYGIYELVSTRDIGVETSNQNHPSQNTCYISWLTSRPNLPSMTSNIPH